MNIEGIAKKSVFSMQTTTVTVQIHEYQVSKKSRNIHSNKKKGRERERGREAEERNCILETSALELDAQKKKRIKQKIH